MRSINTHILLGKLLAAANCGRKAYGFEIKKDFYKSATNIVLPCVQRKLF